jgi:tetratricopeptide (TPR) repeat protein
MSYRIKLPSRPSAPDEAQLRGGMERLADFCSEYRIGIAIAVVVLVLAVGVLLGVGWYDHRQAEQALQIERQASKLMQDRPPEQPARADTNLRLAIELYRRVVDEYPRAPVAALAVYRLGNALTDAKDIGGAIDAYQRYLRNYGSHSVLVPLVYQRLGYAYLLKGDREQASKTFAAVLDIPGALNKDQALFELGKLEEAQARPEGALARYQELMKAYPQSPFASEAAVRVRALEVKKMPAPEPGKK